MSTLLRWCICNGFTPSSSATLSSAGWISSRVNIHIIPLSNASLVENSMKSPNPIWWSIGWGKGTGFRKGWVKGSFSLLLWSRLGRRDGGISTGGVLLLSAQGERTDSRSAKKGGWWGGLREGNFVCRCATVTISAGCGTRSQPSSPTPQRLMRVRSKKTFGSGLGYHGIYPA